jgi:chromate reductase
MKKIIAFGASSSIHSINKKLATYAASCVPNAQATILDLNDYEMPIFSVDRQNKDGFPQLAHDFKDLLMSADGIIISFAEHNSYKSIHPAIPIITAFSIKVASVIGRLSTEPKQAH